MYDLNEFAQRLVYYRYKKGMSQQELADKSGVAVQSIHRYEHGYRYPSILLLQWLCQALEVSSNELINLGPINTETPKALLPIDDFAKRLKYFRELKGLTQKELVEASGISLSQIKFYEGYRSYPNVLMLKKLCDALDVSGGDLLGF